MGQDLHRYRAAISFKSAGFSSKTANILMGAGFVSIAELRATPWSDRPHVRGLERRLLASRGCGPVMVAQIRAVYLYGHVRGGEVTPPVGASHRACQLH